MRTLTDIRIYTGAMRREGDDLHATDVKLVSNEWVYINADDDSTNIVRVPSGAVCECEPQPIPEPTPQCDNSGTNVLATLLRGADGAGIIGGYFSSDGSLYLKMSDESEVFAGKINLSNYYTKSEVDGKLDDKVGRDETIEFAKDLTGVPETTPVEFTFRPSAGTKSIRDESAVIRRIKGNTTVWGQLLGEMNANNWNQYSDTYTDVEYLDNGCKSTILFAYAGGNVYQLGLRYKPTVTHYVSGHKYMVIFDAHVEVSGQMSVETNGTTYYSPRIEAGQWVTTFVTFTRNGTVNNFYVKPPKEYQTTASVGKTYSVRNAMLFDLTALYEAGNEPTTIEEFKRLYPDSYYPYCEPEVRSMRAAGIETIGANAFNKDSVVGGLINADGTVTSNDIYSVAKIEVVPNKMYTLTNVANAANTTYTYAFHDSYDNVISVGEIKNSVTKPVSVSGDVTMPINARYMRVVVHNDYLDTCCVNLKHSGTLTAEETTYFKEVRALPDIAKYFPEGMHGIGDVFDEINEDNAIKRFGVVDLGTLTWNPGGTGTTDIYKWQTQELIARPASAFSEVPNIICVKYKTGTQSDTWIKIDCITVSSTGNLFLFDSNFTTIADKAAFVASLQGVLLYYELAEPIVTPITEPLQLDYKVADFGTEKVWHFYPSSPFRADIVYQFNAEGRIRDNSRNIERLESIVDSVKDDEGYLYSNGEKVDMRFTRSLIPVGTSIPAKANLNTVAYLKVGKYYCSLNADAKTITNCPTSNAFMMEVFNPLSTVVDNEVDNTHVYRIRILTEYSTGIQYFQYCTVGGTVNNWIYDSWYVCPRTKFALNSSKNDGTAAIGSRTQGVYVDSTGTLQKMAYALNKTVPSNAVFTDTDTKVTAVGNHYVPVEDESAVITAAEGEVVVGLIRDAAGHVVGVISTPATSINMPELDSLLQNVTATELGGVDLKNGFIGDSQYTYALPTSADGSEDDIFATKSTLKRINGQVLYGTSLDNIVIDSQLPASHIDSSISGIVVISSGRVNIYTTPITEGATFILGAPTTDVVDEVWTVRFSIDEANVGDVYVHPSVNLTIKWANGIAPTFENGKYYELSFRVIGSTYLGVWASFE